MKLSVIILNYNVRYFLELCLCSVTRSLEGLEAEIVVIDNASQDDSCEMVESLFPQVKLLKNAANVGFAKANNQAAKVAKGEWLCFLNPDTVVGEGFFKIMLKQSYAIENLGILGCRLIDGSGTFLPESKRNTPTIKVSFQKLLGNASEYYASHIAETEFGNTDILVGAFMLLKRSVYESVNGLDEDFFMYAEDVDLSYRILKKGFKNVYLGQHSIIHFKGESTKKDSEYLKRFYGSMQIFYHKHFRKNMLYDLLVWIGIRVIPIINRKDSRSSINSSQVIFVSEVGNSNIERFFKLPVKTFSKIEALEEHTTYIFDIDSISFDDIIALMNDSNLTTSNYRFYVPKSRFILGSDNSNDRGQLVLISD